MTRLCLPLVLKNPDRPAGGLLFVGDPHVWSRQPGRRRDARFMDTVLGKLEQAAEIANRLNLQAVCLGDLLHDDRDHDPEMLIKLTRVLQKFDRKMVCLVGNHDKDELWLSERNALLLLEVAEQIELIDRPGFWGRIQVEDQGRTSLVAIGGSPYGAAIPNDVAELIEGGGNGTFERAHALLGVDRVVWLTHHDLAFDGAYPNAEALHEILGADIAVNGHMHGTTLPQRFGRTSWYNPGNITRMSVDMADHVPSVWSWSPLDDSQTASAQGVRVPRLARIELQHVPGADIFDFEGRHARAAAIVEDLPAAAGGSAFVARIKQGQEAQRTDDAEFIQLSLQTIMTERKTGEGARRILERLAHEAIDQEAL